MKTTTMELMKNARANMRSWALRWRETRALRDRQGMAVARERAIIWRETAQTLYGQQLDRRAA